MYAGCMVQILPAEEEAAELVTEYTLDSVTGVVASLKKIAEDPKSKPMEVIRALREIAELRGYKIDRSIKNIRNFSHEELRQAIRDLVLPTLSPFGVEAAQRELVLDARNKATS